MRVEVGKLKLEQLFKLKLAQNNPSLFSFLHFFLETENILFAGSTTEDVKYTRVKASVRSTYTRRSRARGTRTHRHARARPRASRSKSWHKQLHPTYLPTLRVLAHVTGHFCTPTDRARMHVRAHTTLFPSPSPAALA